METKSYALTPSRIMNKIKEMEFKHHIKNLIPLIPHITGAFSIT